MLTGVQMSNLGQKRSNLFIWVPSVPALEAAVAQPGIDTVNAETSNDVESLEHVNNIDMNNTNKD